MDKPRNDWKTIGREKRSGVLTGLFSVYSKDSIGVADFSDLKLLIDWCVMSGNSILELLPMNDLGSTFCPYDAVSSFALEPSYISLQMLPGAGKGIIAKRIAALKKDFPAGRPYVNYSIKAAKLAVLREIFDASAIKPSGEFKSFMDENSYWLEDYALYKAVKEKNGGKPWYEWPEPYKDRRAKEMELFRRENGKDVSFHMWVQWQTSIQFKAAKEHAAKKKVLLNGDLPILISRDSADVWSHPEFFKLDFAAGAPPDMYCAKGQRWGMPTYEWDVIAGDAYRYPKEKLKYAGNFYDILRVDHVVGLFRIWSIPYNDPAENEGLNGTFNPRDEKEWDGHGRKILAMMLEGSGMLLAAEDLGVIPKECPKALAEFEIPGNDVQRWVKDWKTKHDFLPPKEYRAMSVSMLSTHDTTNWVAWWENEAGTVDEALFIRKCADRKIDYSSVKPALFDNALSRHGRLRWLKDVSSKERYIEILGKRPEELADFIELYENTYMEKEKLWKGLGLEGGMRESCDSRILEAALTVTLESRSVFSINLIFDWLMLTNIFKGDPYTYRVNTPGTISDKNWSLTIPVSLEDLTRNKVTSKIRKMVASSGRG